MPAQFPAAYHCPGLAVSQLQPPRFPLHQLPLPQCLVYILVRLLPSLPTSLSSRVILVEHFMLRFAGIPTFTSMPGNLFIDLDSLPHKGARFWYAGSAAEGSCTSLRTRASTLCVCKVPDAEPHAVKGVESLHKFYGNICVILPHCCLGTKRNFSILRTGGVSTGAHTPTTHGRISTCQPFAR
jgi:hypothetical protein